MRIPQFALAQMMLALRLTRQRLGGLRVELRGRFPAAGNVADLDFNRRYGTPAENRRFLNRTIFTRAKRKLLIEGI